MGNPEKITVIKIVKEMHELAKVSGITAYKSQASSPDTIATYKRIWSKELANNQGMEGVSRASWYVHRAALLTLYSSLHRQARREADRNQRTGDLAAAVLALDEARKALARFIEVSNAQKPEERKKRASKRGKRPTGWREAVLASIAPGCRAAAAVLFATGCRPAELEHGVKVTHSADSVTVRIEGAKVSEATNGGQIWRELVFAAGSSAAVALANVSGEVSCRRSTLRNALARAGEKAGTGRVSAYDFRHALASDLKAAGDREAVSLALGHASSVSAQRYGLRSLAEGKGTQLASVTAFRPLKHADSGPRAGALQPYGPY